MAEKVWLIDARIGIGGKGVCDEVSEARVDDEDG
jgi:hypothetical protein